MHKFFSFQTCFTKSLAQKIRHKRLAIKQKSQGSEKNTPGEPVRKRFRALEYATTSETLPIVTEDAVKNYVQELKKEWAKAKKDQSHIRVLLKYTHESRKQLLEEHPNGCIRPIIDR